MLECGRIFTTSWVYYSDPLNLSKIVRFHFQKKIISIVWEFADLHVTLQFKVLLVKDNYIEDLREIREMMSKSSRVISLSGLSGISAGIIALVGAWLAYRTVYDGQDYLSYRQAILDTGTLVQLVVIAVCTILLAVATGVFFTQRQSKVGKQKVWDMHTRQLLLNLSIPLVAGGVLCMILLFKGYVGLVAPLTMIFYGLALVNASKYVLTEIRSLGLLEVALGLLATQFIGYGLIFWAVGFGVLHIVYGILMQLKYKS